MAAEVSVDLDRVADAAIAALAVRLPEYQHAVEAGGDDARATAGGTLALLLGATRDRDLMASAAAHIRLAAHRRSLRGVPLDVMLEALAIQRDVLAEALEDGSRTLGLADRGALVATRRLERAASAMVVAVARGHMDATAEGGAGGGAGGVPGDRLVALTAAVNRSLDIGEVAQSGLAAVCSVAGAAAAALWLPLPTGLHLAYTSGLRWGDDARLRKQAERAVPLVARAAAAGRPVKGSIGPVGTPFHRAAAVAVTSGRGRKAVLVAGFGAEIAAPQLAFLGAAAVPFGEALARAERHRNEARTDRLTALPNRHEFDRALVRALATAERHRRPLALVLLDLDGLKRINDSQGHAVGDAALRRAAEALRVCIRAGDTAARIGGDEFAVAMPDARLASAEAVASRVAEALAGAGLGISHGVAQFEPGMAAADLFDIADRRLYEEKRARRPAP